MKKIIIRIFLVSVVLLGHFCFCSDLSDLQKKLENKYNEAKHLTFSDIPYIGDIPVPKEVKSIFDKIKITDVKFSSGVTTAEEGYKSGFIVSGTVEIYGAKSRVTTEFIAPIDIMAVAAGNILPKNIYYRFTLQLPIGWKLSDTFSQLKSIETLKFESVAFNISNFNVAVENRLDDFGIKKLPEGIEIHPEAGFTIVGVAKPAGLLKTVANILRYDKEFFLIGNIPQDKKTKVYEYQKSSFQGVIPMAIELIKGLKMTAMQLTISPEPLLEIKTAALLAVPKEKEDLVFVSSLKIEDIESSIFGALDGVWRKPFGIIPITVEDVGLGFTFLNTPFKLSGGSVRGKFIFNEEKEKYVEIALQGSLSDAMNLGNPEIAEGDFAEADQAAEAAQGTGGSQVETDDGGSVASDEGGIVLYGAFKGGIYLEDIIDIYLSMAKELNIVSKDLKKKVLSIVPNIGFDEGKIYFVPQPTEIADQNFDKGTRFMAKANILGQRIIIDLKFTPDGFRGLGFLKPLKLGPLSITGEGVDKREDTKDDGAVVFLRVDASHLPRLYVSCIAELDILGGIKKEAEIDISGSGIHYKIITDLMGLYETSLEMSASAKSLSSIFVKGSMEQSALKKFDKLINNACNDLIKKSEKDLDNAKKKTSEWWDNEINKLEEKMKQEKEAVVNALRKEEQRLRNLADNYEKNLKNIEKDLLEKSKNKFEKAEKAAKKCKKGNVVKCGNAGYYYTLGAGAWSASKAMKGIRKNKVWTEANKAFLKASAEVVSVAKQVSKIVGEAYSIHNAVAYGFAQSMKYASIGAIEAAGVSAEGIAEAGKALGKLGSNAVNIKEISFDADAKDLKGKKLPKVKVKGKVLGIDISMSLQLDLDDVGDFVEKIAKKAVDQIAGPFKSKKDKPKKPSLKNDVLAQAMKQIGKNPEKILIPNENIVMLSDTGEPIELRSEEDTSIDSSQLKQAIQGIFKDSKKVKKQAKKAEKQEQKQERKAEKQEKKEARKAEKQEKKAEKKEKKKKK